MNVETIEAAVERLIKSVMGSEHTLYTDIERNPNLNTLKGEIEYLFTVQIVEKVNSGMDIVALIKNGS
jgi:hypothetical protein